MWLLDEAKPLQATKPDTRPQATAPQASAPEDQAAKATQPAGSAPAPFPVPPNNGWVMPGAQPPGGWKQQQPEAKHEVGAILEPALWLIGAMVLCAVVLMIVKAVRDRKPAVTEDDLHEQMAKFRASYDEGEMSKEEYDRVHKLLAKKIKTKAEVTPASNPAPPAGTDPAGQEKPAQNDGSPQGKTADPHIEG